MKNITVKIGGEAGFGIMTTGLFLGKIAIRSGYFAYEYAEYPSLIRGGHNVIEVRISDEKIYSQEQKVDVLVSLNAETLRLHVGEMKNGGVIVLDKDKIDTSKITLPHNNITFIHVPFTKILQTNSLSNVMINNIALGSLMHVLGVDDSVLKELISQTFARKGQEVIDQNLNAAKLGFDAAKASHVEGYSIKIPKRESFETQLYMSGNEAIGLGAIMAGCKFYAAYPMTPSSAILHYLASKGEKSGMVVKHAEDEIAVMNMAVGAAWSGVRSMIGTSGGGFALMVEAVSLAGITETPVVIVMGQRPGPATGLPTWTEQGDLLFILHSGHGEFPKILLAPGDIEEACLMTFKAHNFAEKYQTPVFVIGDKYLQEGHQSVEEMKIKNHSLKIERGKLLSQDDLNALTSPYKRYAVSEDGISPRAIPGMTGALHQANSYEHMEDGHTTEDANERIKQVDKRNQKIATFLKEDARLPTLYGDPHASLTIVSWGSMKLPILQAMKDCGNKFNFLHFTYMWPLPKDELKAMLSGFSKMLLVENNSTAQLGQLIQMVTGIEIKEKLLKYSGRPMYPEEIIERIGTLV